MITETASVIVVSRHRAAELVLCLASLSQQDHPNFEIIVVADPAGLAAASRSDLAAKLVPFDEANISAARNLGIAAASGGIVAFIDDDAVAEPTWLARLAAAFANPKVVAATGFVRGRNGISFQWQACEVDAQGLDHSLPPEAAILAGRKGRAVKTQGTNCAFRRAVLAAIGGFDPAFHFYLDEADVNLRMAGLGLTAVVPEAQVQHGFAASARRRKNRLPTTLHEIAASIAVFLRRHSPETLEQESIPAIAHQQARITRLQAEGKLDSSAAAQLQHSLAMGWDDGMARALQTPPPLPECTEAPVKTKSGPRRGHVLAGRFWQKTALCQRAATLAEQGEIATVFIFFPSLRAHKMRYVAPGYWLQTGGLFGWSTRSGRRFRLTGFRRRVAEESLRISNFRPIR